MASGSEDEAGRMASTAKSETSGAAQPVDDVTTARITSQLAALRTACNGRDVQGFSQQSERFVAEWQGQRAAMEANPAFVDAPIMQSFVAMFGDSSRGDLSWHALKVSGLLARADANTQTLLESGGVAAALGVLRGDQQSAAQLEVALALLQNVAYSTDGVASILRENGVSAVLHAMRTHAASAAVQRVGLGVLWNLCDSDEHWVAFLREGPSLVTVLLATLAHHPDEPRIEESVIDMLWDFSSTGDGQAHIISAGGVPPILGVMGAACHDEDEDDDLQKKALSMLWNLTISAAGISVLVQHAGVATVLEVMRSHSAAEEVQQNALGVLRNISDAPEGQAGILRAGGLPLLLETLRQHATCDEIVELSLECLANVCQASVQHGIALLLEGGLEALRAPPLLGSAAPLRRRLAYSLEGAAPLLGALLHASTTSSEAKACIVVALAFFTLPPTAPAPASAAEGRSPRSLGGSANGAHGWHGAFWPLGGPGGWHEDGSGPHDESNTQAAGRATAVSGLPVISVGSPGAGGVGGGTGSGKKQQGKSGVEGAHVVSPPSGGAPGRLHDFAGWLDDEETSDVLFEIEGHTLHAHRIVLLCSRASEVFRAMLRHPMREQATAAVTVEGISYEVFRLLVTYLYTGEVHVPAHLASELLLACERYMVYPLQLECAVVVVQSLRAEQLWEMLAVASSLHLPPPPEQSPELPRPADVLRDAAVHFLCESTSLPSIVAEEEFTRFADEIVPRIYEILQTRLLFLRGAPLLS